MLRNWPVREIELNVRLSDAQRVAFYEFVTTSLKAAETLSSACPAEARAHPDRPHGDDAQAACRRARRHRRDPSRARALL